MILAHRQIVLKQISEAIIFHMNVPIIHTLIWRRENFLQNGCPNVNQKHARVEETRLSSARLEKQSS